MTTLKPPKTLVLITVAMFCSITAPLINANMNAMSDINIQTSDTTAATNLYTKQSSRFDGTAQKIINHAAEVINTNDKLFAQHKLNRSQIRAIYSAADKIAPPVKIDSSNTVMFTLKPIIEAENNLAYANALNKILTDKNPKTAELLNAAKTLADPDKLNTVAEQLSTIIKTEMDEEMENENSGIDYNQERISFTHVETNLP